VKKLFLFALVLVFLLLPACTPNSIGRSIGERLAPEISQGDVVQDTDN